MKTKIISLAILISALLIVSCSNASPTLEVKPTLAVPTATIQISTETPAPTLSPSVTPVVLQKTSQACVDLDLNSKSKISMKGVALFDNLSPNIVTTIFLHDLESFDLKTLATPGTIWRMWDISPNRKQMLYEYETYKYNSLSGYDYDYRLVVADSSGHPVKEFDTKFPGDLWPADYYNWQNNESIRVTLFFESQESFRMSPRTYNPFTGDYKALKTDFPDYVGKDLDWGLDWIALSTMHYQGANIVYDPSLTRVVYPKKGEVVSLLDVGSDRELANIHLPKWGRLPKWSTNGERLAIIGTANPDAPKASEEIFIVQRDGDEFKRMTYFSNSFEQSAIADYAWSPDGTKIAFWSYTGEDDPKVEKTQSKLMILDVKTGEVTDLCMQGISAVTHLSDSVLFSRLEPIWSPDGTQIMVSQWAAPEDKNNKNYNVLVVDLPSLNAIKIDTNKQPAGWMTKEL